LIERGDYCYAEKTFYLRHERNKLKFGWWHIRNATNQL